MKKYVVLLSLALASVACGAAPSAESAAAPPVAEASAVVPWDADALRAAIDDVKAGASITVPAGDYDIADVKIRKDLTLIGAPGAVFFSSAPAAKGLLNPLPGVSLRVENIVFRDAVSPDKNGAGIRHDGKDLTIVNCIFRDNENGVLATGGEDGRITITGSSFLNNGHGDGYSHGIYVVNAALLEIMGSIFKGTRIGHHVKSLAAKTVITDTKFDEADGRTSYALDASKGGDVTFSKNVIHKSANADNPAVVNYDLTRGGQAVALTIADNIVNNFHPRGRLLRNETGLEPLISNNTVSTSGGQSSDQSATGEQRMQLREVAMGAAGPTTAAPLALEQWGPKDGKRSGLIRAPEFNPPDDAIAAFKMQNNWRDDSDADYFTFGQAFIKGALQPGDRIAARFGNEERPAQIDVKALHVDGSVRHAVVTIEAPALQSEASIEGALVKSGAAVREDFDAAVILRDRYDFPLALKFTFGDETTRDFEMNVRTAAINAFADAEHNLWLDGPLVKETRIEAEAAPHLALRFDIRVYRDRDIRTSVVFSNEKTFSNGRRESLYDVVIGDAAAPAFTAAQVGHHRSSNWRRVFWTGAQPKLHIAHDLHGLIAARAVAPLDPSLGVSANSIASHDVKTKDAAPLSPGSVTQYFPMTGGRSDLGLYPQWTSHYLVAQTERAKRVMLANADAGGAVPWHFIDEATGAPVSVEDYPKFWSDERGLQDQFKPDNAHPDLFASSAGDWTEDQAHKPALNAAPWLVTGDRYYADELAMQGAFALFGRWPDLREGGLKATDMEQVRETAWSLRDMSDAAWLLPDNHPSKEYLERAVSVNLRLIKEKYVDNRAMRAAGEIEGYFEEDVYLEPERITPWQNDYVALGLWLTAWRGDDNAVAIMRWAQNFHAGRILTDEFPMKYSAAYVFPALGVDGGGPVSTWSALAARLKEIRGDYGEEMDGYFDSATGYFATALAALTAVASTTGDIEAFDALAVLVRYTDDSFMWSATKGDSVKDDNNFLFSLVLPDGAMITRKHFRKRGKGAVVNEFIYGGDGADDISGAAGSDAIVGLDGDDRLSGGDGNDVISGGAGADTIIGGNGDDKLGGGEGPDIFVFDEASFGRDIITDFDPAGDRIAIKVMLFPSPEAALSAVTSSPNGAEISLPDGSGEILLKNVDIKTLEASNFTTIQ